MVYDQAAMLTLDEKLDQALEGTFPASDPFALSPGVSYLDRAQLLALLNELLEAERAGARGVSEMSRQAIAGAADALEAVAKDEARFCAMLTRQIRRHGGEPSARTGAFYEKLMAANAQGAQLDLLNRGQGWVARKLADALPRIADAALYQDVSEMLDIHVRNIRQCNELIARSS